MTDELTGVANRGLFMRLLVQTLSGAERTEARTAVLFIDVDDFKAVNVDADLFHGYNERYTHIAGHRALACRSGSRTPSRRTTTSGAP